jgi:hypothetical protein
MNLFEKAYENRQSEDFNTCYICGCKFKLNKSNIRRGWGMFCSKSCSAKWRKNKKDKGTFRDFRIKQLEIMLNG